MSKDKVFCLAPWVTSHTTADGARSVCCATNVHHQYQTLGEWWNSEELRKMRLDMLAGKPPADVCKSCINNTRASAINTQINERNQHLMKVVRESTDENGYTDLTPIEFEIKHILCNLKCRHCYDRSSSSIRVEKKKAGQTVYPLSIMYKNEIEFHDNVNDIEWIDENTTTWCWTGGEPFMSPLIIPALTKMADAGLTHIKQVVITNAMLTNQKRLIEVLNLLAKFDIVTMIVSVDGWGESGEFSRTGWNEKVFVKNIALFKSMLPKSHYAANFVLHAVSITTMPDVFKYCLENDIRFQGQLLSFDELHYLNYNLIKPEVFERIFEKCREIALDYPVSKHGLLEDMITTFYNNYKPCLIGAAEYAKLAEDCAIRNQDGLYEKLTAGLLNE